MTKQAMSARQKAFMLAPLHRINLLYGSVRSGKTWVSLLKFAVFVAQAPPQHEFLMVAKTITTLKRNCLGLLTQLVGERNFKYSASSKKAMLFGKTVWLEGAADVRAENKIRGMTLGGAYIDELSLIPKDFYLMVLSRLSQPNAALIATTNPDSKASYTYTDIVQNKKINARIWRFLLDDNIALTRDYKKAVKSEYTGVFYRRFILGEFCAAQGAVYSVFADKKASFVSDNLDYDYVQIGVDFGGNGSAHSFTAVGLKHDFSRITALLTQRISAKGTTPDDLYNSFSAFIEEVKAKYGAISCVFADSAEQLLISGLKARHPHLIIRNAKKGHIIDRIRATTAMMSQGRFFITQSCTILADAFENAVYDDKKAADTRLDNGTSDIDSLDSFEYAWEKQMRGYLIASHEKIASDKPQ